MSATDSLTYSLLIKGAPGRGNTDADEELGSLLVRSVPRPVLRELSVLGARCDLSREAYVRGLLEGYVALVEREGAAASNGEGVRSA